MNTGENKRLHLQMIQTIINRMAANSFSLKGWSITIISALFALLTVNKIDVTKVLLISIIPLLVFWILDAYFLRQERLFREFYKKICDTAEDDIDFLMKTKPCPNKIIETLTVLRVAISSTLAIFYGGILILLAIINKSGFIS